MRAIRSVRADAAAGAGRPTAMREGSRPMVPGRVLLVAMWLLGAGPVEAQSLIDAVLGEVDGRVVTASDVALARALGALGLEASPAPITRGDLDRFIEGRLAVVAARRLGLEASPAEIEAAWEAAAGRVGGGRALEAWLARSGIEPAWARSMVAADVERRRFLDVRFRAFAFVSEDAVLAALGPGSHDAAARASVRERLEGEEARRALVGWIEEATREATIRRLLAEGASVACPLPMPP